MTLKLLTEHHSEFLSLKSGCTGLSESTLVQTPHCWKSCVTAQMAILGIQKSKLTHISLASFLWDIGKQCKTRSDAQNAAPDQVLHCLLTEVSFKI